MAPRRPHSERGVRGMGYDGAPMANFNPYASPQRPPPASLPTSGAPEPWEIGEVLTAGVDALKMHWPTLVGAHFVAALVGEIPMLVPLFATLRRGVAFGSPAYWRIAAPYLFVQLVIGAFFGPGLVRMSLQAARGADPDFRDLFGGASRWLAMLTMTLLMVGSICVGSLFFFLPGVIAALGMSLASFFLVDQDLGPLAAIRASWQATRGHKGRLFGFAVVSVAIMMVGYLACFVGFFVAEPILSVASAVIYLHLSGKGRGSASMQEPFYFPPMYGPR